jgi:2-amino-4-hydroxy-6-hydroxymethyldihydropteridine diphosphokinase
MNKAYLLIGGNIGDRENYLEKARDLIVKRTGRIVTASSIYETAAWGIEDQSAFLNQVLLVQTELIAFDLLDRLLNIEEELGRKRMIKFGPRIIDLDILLFNDDVINENNLKVPHPALPNRRFALIPLCEIAPTYHHPVINKSIEALLVECKDELPVIKYDGR